MRETRRQLGRQAVEVAEVARAGGAVLPAEGADEEGGELRPLHVVVGAEGGRGGGVALDDAGAHERGDGGAGGVVGEHVDELPVAGGDARHARARRGRPGSWTSPAWLATMVQAPGPTSVMVDPLAAEAVQTAAGPAVKVTGRPEVAVALTVNGGSPCVAGDGCGKSMVCAAWATVRVPLPLLGA